MAQQASSDEALIAAAGQGDERAFGLLYDRHGGVAYGLALRILRDRALAEDAVQEGFLTAWRLAATYERSRATPRAWLLTLVHRRAVDLVRRTARTAALASRVAAEPCGERFESQPFRDDDRRRVQAALAALPHGERRVLELAYYGGLSQSEVATALGVPAGTVKSRTCSALARLRARLAAEDHRPVAWSAASAPRP